MLAFLGELASNNPRTRVAFLKCFPTVCLKRETENDKKLSVFWRRNNFHTTKIFKDFFLFLKNFGLGKSPPGADLECHAHGPREKRRPSLFSYKAKLFLVQILQFDFFLLELGSFQVNRKDTRTFLSFSTSSTSRQPWNSFYSIAKVTLLSRTCRPCPPKAACKHLQW